MSDQSQGQFDNQREELAAAFDRTIDPLASHAATFERLDVDPFNLFHSEVLPRQNLAEGTLRKYERVFRQWQAHMAREGRHPACPSEAHVHAFVDYLIEERGNQPDTARTKLWRLDKVYRCWQDDPVFPHPPSFNPFKLVLSRRNLERPPTKKPPHIPLPILRAHVQAITDIRERAVVATQLKLGLRASELCNLRLEDLHIDNRDLERAYPNLGNHDRLGGRRNTVHVASKFEREKNKSRRPRLLPIDEELQACLTHYLLTRPDIRANSVFYVPYTHNPPAYDYVNRVWTEHFQEEYPETDQHRSVSSHFGRHWFTTYWQVKRDLNRELVKYMRGDLVEGDQPSREGIDAYIHTYYEDIEAIYRECIFSLGLND